MHSWWMMHWEMLVNLNNNNNKHEMLLRANSQLSTLEPVQNKRKGKNVLSSIYLIILGLLLLGAFLPYGDINGSHHKYPLAYAHSFEPNNLATFLSLSNRAQVELILAITDFPANVSLALEHAENAVELINVVYRMDDDIVDDSDFMKRYNDISNSQNSSIHALVIANLVDQVLIEYGKANDIRFDLTNMSNMVNLTMIPHTTNSSSHIFGPAGLNDSDQFHHNLSGLVNLEHYETALRLSETAYEVFNNISRQPASLTTRNDSTSLNKLEESLTDLTSMVRANVPAQNLMAVVHQRVHPYLQAAYDLKLKR
jgi:hypothetical protein